jgi:AcrR family transcriptional regulator
VGSTRKKSKDVAKKGPIPTPEIRRIPTQERSRARVERILDAAAHVFADVGYDAATTEGIAALAGTSIGSVYQFFPNKKALFDAIGARYLTEAQALFHTLMNRPLDRPWTELLDEAIDAFRELDRKSIAFRAVWRNFHQSGDFLAHGEALNQSMAARTATVLAAFAPDVDADKIALVSTVVVETLSSMLFLALRRPEPQATQIVAEAKILIRRYLEPYAR